MDFVFDTSPAIAPFVDLVWRTRTERAGRFVSEAGSRWELVFSRCNGTTAVTAHGPETRASEAEYPADAEFFGITFTLGTFMPALPVRTLIDRQDAMLPAVSATAFWLSGTAWEVPVFDNADVFIARLISAGLLVRDPIVAATLAGRPPDMSIRALQYRFLQATGLTHKTIQQIDRARAAVALLEQGASAVDTALRLGYFDQAHLTNSLRRFVGRTPAQIARSHPAR